MIKNLKKVVNIIDNRFKKLPTFFEGVIDSQRKLDSEKIVYMFRKGIENDEFGLKRLKSNTIKAKQKKGYPKPETPLYGLGGNNDRTYRKLFIITKLKNGYRIRPSQKLHHSGRVKLATLYYTHEYGKTIVTKYATIKIPPRPAGKKAYKKYVANQKTENIRDITNEGLNEYMKKGSDKKIKYIIKKKLSEASNYV